MRCMGPPAVEPFSITKTRAFPEGAPNYIFLEIGEAAWDDLEDDGCAADVAIEIEGDRAENRVRDAQAAHSVADLTRRREPFLRELCDDLCRCIGLSGELIR